MIIVKLKSYSVKNVYLFINKIKEMIKSLEHSSIRRLSRLPEIKKRITLLKSPHVNSKAKEQFSLNIHSCILWISTNNEDDVIKSIYEIAPSQLEVKLIVSK